MPEASHKKGKGLSCGAKLEMRGIVKDFPGVRALDHVDFSANAGEILALVGENGAGKSTLMKVLSGVHPFGSYEGQMLLDGSPVQFNGPRTAQKAGVAIIHQELNLVPYMTVAENIYLCREPQRFPGVVDFTVMYKNARDILQKLDVPIRADAPLSSLSVGRQQLVEIAKALAVDAEVLVLDEPTSALADKEIEDLFAILRKLREEGKTLIYISHKLDEIFSLADRVTILRDGATVGTWDIGDLTSEDMVTHMVGREISQLFPKKESVIGDKALEVEGLTVLDRNRPRGHQIRDISFYVREGEALGVAGLMGAGRTELLSALFGVYGKRVTGAMRLFGKPVRPSGPRQAIAEGLAMVTEDRKLHGLALGMSIRENLTLAALRQIAGRVLSHKREKAVCRKYIDEMQIKTPSMEASVNTLSGGNQQKVVIGKWLATKPKVLLLDDPTRGVDVGAKAEIYQIVSDLTAQGVAVVIASSELLELLGMCDRILVMREGCLAGEIPQKEATEKNIMRLATGAVESVMQT